MANPSPPLASYPAMHTRAGYADGAVLTTAELDLAAGYLVAQDGSGNAQALTSLRFGTKGFIFGSGNQLWFAGNAYTVDAGTTWYPFDETAVSYAIETAPSGILLKYSPALNADGPITWTTIYSFNSGGAVFAGTLVRLTANADASAAPVGGITRVRDTAALTVARKLTLNVGSDAQAVIFSRNGSSGGFVRNVCQADGSTVIKAVADNFSGTFIYDANAALWFLEAYEPCS